MNGYEARAGRAGSGLNSAPGDVDRKTASKVATAANVSRDTVRKFEAVQAEAAPEVLAVFERGEKALKAIFKDHTEKGREAATAIVQERRVGNNPKAP